MGSEAHRWDIEGLQQALVEVGLSPTVVDLSPPPDSGVQRRAPEPPPSVIVASDQETTGSGRDVLPWAAQLAAALAPAVLLQPATPHRASEPSSGIVARAAVVTSPVVVATAAALAPPVVVSARPATAPRLAVRARPRRSGWPVVLCGIVALGAGALALLESPVGRGSAAHGAVHEGAGAAWAAGAGVARKFGVP